MCARRTRAQQAAVAALVHRLTSDGLRPEQVLIALESHHVGCPTTAQRPDRDTILRWAMEALSQPEPVADTPTA
jgi:hypothetical protein